MALSVIAELEPLRYGVREDVLPSRGGYCLTWTDSTDQVLTARGGRATKIGDLGDEVQRKAVLVKKQTRLRASTGKVLGRAWAAARAGSSRQGG